MTDAKPFTEEELDALLPFVRVHGTAIHLMADWDQLVDTLDAERARREAAEARAATLLAVLRGECGCEGGDAPPTSWGAEGPVRIPHHCDCPLYTFELPDPERAPTAYADAMRHAFIRPEPVAGEEEE